MKYLVSYYEDAYSRVAETTIECNNEEELKKLVDKYCEENLKHLEIAGAKWSQLTE